jgi:hypothetical protein
MMLLCGKIILDSIVVLIPGICEGKRRLELIGGRLFGIQLLFLVTLSCCGWFSEVLL